MSKEKRELRKEVFEFMKEQGQENKLSLDGNPIPYGVVNHLIASFHEYKMEQVKNCSIPDVSNRYQMTDIKLADWESVAIGDTKTNKVICHFITENGFDEAVEIAKKITKFLNAG